MTLLHEGGGLTNEHRGGSTHLQSLQVVVKQASITHKPNYLASFLALPGYQRSTNPPPIRDPAQEGRVNDGIGKEARQDEIATVATPARSIDGLLGIGAASLVDVTKACSSSTRRCCLYCRV